MSKKRLLVVDDERNVRRHISMMLRHSPYEIYEASNGSEALELLERVDVDLLITDIRMPKVDGIQLIRQALAAFPDLPSIVLSNYAEFQLAQQAIRSGAKEYLLKATLTEEELNQTIEQLLAATSKRKQSSTGLDRNEMLTITRAMFHERLHNRISTSELKRRAHKHAIKLFQEDRTYQYALLQVDRFSDWLQDKYKGQVELAVFTVENFVSEWCQEIGVEQEIFHISEGKFLIVGSLKEDVDQHEHYVQLQSVIDRFFSVSISVIYGYSAQDLDGLFTSIQQHLSDFDTLFYCPYGTISRVDRLLEEQRNEDVDVHQYFMELLRSSEEFMKIERLPLWIESFLELLAKVRRKPEFIKDDLMMLVTFIEKNGYSVDQAFQRRIKEMSAGHFKEYKQLFKDWLQDNRMYGLHQPEISKALQYIQEHFVEKITLDEVARVANLSRSHFSKVFKEEVGMTLIEYVEMVRMNQARMLLKTTKFSIGEISEMVGISDIFYFSKIYKKRYKVSPSKDRGN